MQALLRAAFCRRLPGWRFCRSTGSGTLVLPGLPQTHKSVEVNEGTLRLASGATVGAAYSPVAAAQEGNGAIVGVPASVDLGSNNGYKLSVQSGSIRIVKKGLVLIVK